MSHPMDETIMGSGVLTRIRKPSLCWTEHPSFSLVFLAKTWHSDTSASNEHRQLCGMFVYILFYVTFLCNIQHANTDTLRFCRHWTGLVFVKDQSSHLVYLNIFIKLQTCENLSSTGRRSCEIIMKEKEPLSHKVVCFQMLDFETSNSKPEVSKSNLWQITSFSKNTSLQRELFLTMFYTINLSPLLVTK